MFTFQRLVTEELKVAREQHPSDIHNLHEAWGVIMEEVDEFWDEVKLKQHLRNNICTLRELVQIAAMCQRTAEDLEYCKKE